MQLAVDSLNSANKDYKLSVDFEDSAADPQKGVTVFTDLTENKHDPIVYTCGQTVINATTSLANRTGTVLMDTSSGGPQLVGSTPWYFSDFINTGLEGHTMADYMWKTLGYRNIAVDYRSDSYGADAYSIFSKYWTQLGGKITVAVTHDRNAPDQLSQVAKVKNVAGSTDAIYVMTADKDAGVFIHEARQSGVTDPLVALAGAYAPGMLTIAGKDADGMLFTSPSYDLTSSTPEVTAFKAAYAAKFGTTVPAPFVMSYYEGVLVWNQAIQYLRAHKLSYTGANIATALRSGQTFTGLGHDVKFSASQVAQLPVQIQKIVNGSAVPVTTVATTG